MRSYLISNLIDASQENSKQYFDETIIEETLLEFQNHISKLSLKLQYQVVHF